MTKKHTKLPSMQRVKVPVITSAEDILKLFIFNFSQNIRLDIYSWLSLSRPRLSRITAYLKVKILSLPKHENLITGNKILWKRREMNFSSFSQYFQYISNFKSPITHIFVKCGRSINFFLKSGNLICRSTDISKYFRESLGIRDNKSRLYLFICVKPKIHQSKRAFH